MIVVLGIGNILLSDDGVGIRLLDAIRQQCPATPDITYLDGGTLSLSLAEWFAETNSLLVLDAADFKAKPGTVRVLIGSDMDQFSAKSGRSAHEVGLRDLLAIGRLTETLPARRALIVIQIQTIDWGLKLSDLVAQALPLATRQAVELITCWMEGDCKA